MASDLERRLRKIEHAAAPVKPRRDFIQWPGTEVWTEGARGGKTFTEAQLDTLEEEFEVVRIRVVYTTKPQHREQE